MQKYFIFFLIGFAIKSHAQITDSTLRIVKLQGAINFRDIGGYKTKSGKMIKWGKIYRSAEISKLTDADLDTLQKRNINYDLDFRGPSEFNAAPDKIPASIIRISLPAGSENVGNSQMQLMQQMNKANSGDSLILPYYTNLKVFGERYKPMFDILLNNDSTNAVLYHCTAGKDRTGIATALILSALGVNENTIMDDYLASNYYSKNNLEKMRTMMVNNYHLKEEVANDLLGVKKKYLQATFDAINAKYGSLKNYLKKEMGLNRKKMKKLKNLYLQ